MTAVDASTTAVIDRGPSIKTYQRYKYRDRVKPENIEIYHSTDPLLFSVLSEQ